MDRIIRKTVGLKNPLRTAVASLPGKVTVAFIYGSVAKRTDASDSDIDLLIVSDDLMLDNVYAAMSSAEKFWNRAASREESLSVLLGLL